MKQRLFLALELTDEQRAALVALRRNMPPTIEQAGRWVPPANLHLTLHFLGDWPAGQLAELKDALTGVEAPALPFSLLGLGSFPKRGAARVLWAGVAAEAALAECHSRLAEALAGLGFALPDRPYSPHITLARFRPTIEREQLAPWLNAQRGWSGPATVASHFTLYESQLGQGPPRYLPLARFPLAP